ncbi:hypothetical protein K7X08_012759 [Anisodus acutangulus]|uniref:Uncharacterized protein n=1 Tax=Anisodus acutangulus TaxID=402998 RepID=A0A9Q1MER1_9SOLA|nr:hypothetical protein K7X08_012759 [Anisodus acutangulus]
MYYVINKSPWSSLDENEAFLTTADSAVKLLPKATKSVSGWNGLEYRTTFASVKPPDASFYPSDMDKMEFNLWKDSLPEDQQKEAMGFFNVIRRRSESFLENMISHKTENSTISLHDLYVVRYSQEYHSLLSEAAALLHSAGDLTSSTSLKRLFYGKADTFLSNDYYDSDIAWMEMDSKLDVTIGSYETYEDTLFGYKATFEAFIGFRDDEATAQVKLFGDHLQVLEKNLPMDNIYKSENVTAAPIRVIQLLYNAGDVKGPQTVAFNLPNDERIVTDRGTSMVMLKNVSEAKYKLLLTPLSFPSSVISNAADNIDVKGPQTVAFNLPNDECIVTDRGTSMVMLKNVSKAKFKLILKPIADKSTIRLELQEFHSSLEEAKSDIVGLSTLKFLMDKDLLTKSLAKSMHVSFLAGCFRSVHFGLEEAHGKGPAFAV